MVISWCARHLLGLAHQDGLEEEDDEPPLSQARFTIYVSCVVGLILVAGLMSGLTLGLMSMDNMELEVLRLSGTPAQKWCASIIIPLVKDHNFLLVTLLMCNAAATETLPLFLDRLADPITAVVVSVTVVLIFGEVLPQAVCSRYGLEIGARCAWFVRLLMLMCAPVAWPVGKVLDFILGTQHSDLFRRSQLMALVDVHGSTAGFGGSLTETEVLVIRGALDLTAKTASKSMTPLDKVFMLSDEDRLDERTIEAILISGHSRIPVYKDRNRYNIIGVLMIKEMVLVDPAEHVPVSSLNIRPLPQLPADTPMYDMLKVFESGSSHMALLVRSKFASPDPASPHALTAEDRWGWDSKSRSGNEHDAPPARGSLIATIKAVAAGVVSMFSRVPDHHNHHCVPQDEEAGYVISRQSSSLTWGGGGMTDPALWPEELEPVGIITIEDVIEELLQQEIIDETDQYIDNMQTSHVDTLLVPQGLPPRLQRYLSAGMFAPRMTLLGAKQRMTAAPLKNFEAAVKDIASGRGKESASVLPKCKGGGLEGDAAAPDQIALTTLHTLPPSEGSPVKRKSSYAALKPLAMRPAALCVPPITTSASAASLTAAAGSHRRHSSSGVGPSQEGLRKPELCASACSSRATNSSPSRESLRRPELCVSALRGSTTSSSPSRESLRRPELCASALSGSSSSSSREGAKGMQRAKTADSGAGAKTADSEGGALARPGSALRRGGLQDAGQQVAGSLRPPRAAAAAGAASKPSSVRHRDVTLCAAPPGAAAVPWSQAAALARDDARPGEIGD